MFLCDRIYMECLLNLLVTMFADSRNNTQTPEIQNPKWCLTKQGIKSNVEYSFLSTCMPKSKKYNLCPILLRWFIKCSTLNKWTY